MVEVLWRKQAVGVPPLIGSLESCAVVGVLQPAVPQTSRAGGMLRVRIETLRRGTV